MRVRVGLNLDQMLLPYSDELLVVRKRAAVLRVLKAEKRGFCSKR